MADEQHDESEDSAIKVTDRRMFTSDGDLREEYQFLEDSDASPDEAPPPEALPTSVADPGLVAGGGGAPANSPTAAAPSTAGRTAPELPGTGPDVGPRFYDLVAALAEPATIYLGDQPLPGGQRSENLELARFYVDLLEVLRQTTEGNLPAQEAAFLEDTLYQLRVRYVQKTG